MVVTTWTQRGAVQSGGGGQEQGVSRSAEGPLLAPSLLFLAGTTTLRSFRLTILMPEELQDAITSQRVESDALKQKLDARSKSMADTNCTYLYEKLMDSALSCESCAGDPLVEHQAPNDHAMPILESTSPDMVK